MKLRRVILLGIAFAGFVVLLLALGGVFGSRGGPGESGGEEQREGASGQTGALEVEIKQFHAESLRGRDWEVTAPLARIDPERNWQLTEPVLIVRRIQEGREEQVEARANLGVLVRQPSDHITLTGDVVVRLTGEQPSELRTDRLEINPDEATGTTDAPITLTAQTREGTQTLRGIGAELFYRKRLARVFRQVRLDLVGGEALLPRGETAGAMGQTTITADGPGVADGVQQTVTLENNVRIVQERTELTADRVEVLVSQEQRRLERFVADGHVAFRVEDVQGTGDSLTRTGETGEIVLSGTPAIVRQGGNVVEAGRLRLEPVSGRITVPQAGRLSLSSREASTAGPLEIAWNRSMEFDRSVHEAMFLGGVEFSDGERAIRCERFVARFDDNDQRLIECRADGGVHVQGRLQSVSRSGQPATSAEGGEEKVQARAEEMILRPEQDMVSFAGGAVIEYGSRTISGERVIIEPNRGNVQVDGPGQLQGTVGDASGESPVRVAWKEGMKFDRVGGRAEFRRDVAFAQGSRSLQADRVSLDISDGQRLRAVLAEGNARLVEEPEPGSKATVARSLEAGELRIHMGADSQPERLEAGGGPILREGNRMAMAERIEVSDAGASIAMLGPGRLEGVADSSGAAEPVVVEWKGDMRFRRSEGLATFRQGVILRQGQRALSADELSARITPDNRLESFETAGPTRIEDGERVAFGNRMTWDATQDIGRLVGDPAEMREGDQRILGELIEFRHQAGSVRISGRYRVDGRLLVGSRDQFLRMLP